MKIKISEILKLQNVGYGVCSRPIAKKRSTNRLEKICVSRRDTYSETKCDFFSKDKCTVTVMPIITYTPVSKEDHINKISKQRNNISVRNKIQEQNQRKQTKIDKKKNRLSWGSTSTLEWLLKIVT